MPLALLQSMLRDQIDSDGEEIFNQPFEDLAAEEEEEENESNRDDDSGVDYNESDNEDEDGSELKQFALTFRKGNYDNEIEDALGGSSIETPHAGNDLYRKPTDWMERNAIGLENVKEQLQKLTRSAEDGDSCRFLHLIHNSENSSDDEPVVWHDSSIDPYWEQLEAALCHNPTNVTPQIESIRIINIELRKETVASLVSCLCSGRTIDSIQEVFFINNNLCGEGVVSLSTLVEQSWGLDHLDLSQNRIDDMNSALCFSRALKAHPSIEFIQMSQCELGNDSEILSVILQLDVDIIDLRHNNIDSSGAVKISEYLEGNPPLKYLELDYNDFDDDDAILLSQALKKNTNLNTLDLCWNKFTSVGVKALLTSLFDGVSLNAISESNHTCELLVFDKCIPIQKLLSSLNNYELDRTGKILIALHDKESLLEYLADMPVELMPDVLAFIQRERDQTLSMSMMYAALRWWNMPSLYSHYCCVSSNTKRKRDD